MLLKSGISYGELEKPVDNAHKDITVFFCSLVLHFVSSNNVKNGIIMSKYALFHREEFENPATAFFFGCAIVITNILC